MSHGTVLRAKGAPGVTWPFCLCLRFRRQLSAQREVAHGDTEALLIQRPDPWAVSTHYVHQTTPIHTEVFPHKLPSQQGPPWSSAEGINSLLEVSILFLAFFLLLYIYLHAKYFTSLCLLSFSQYNVNSKRDFYSMDHGCIFKEQCLALEKHWINTCRINELRRKNPVLDFIVKYEKLLVDLTNNRFWPIYETE